MKILIIDNYDSFTYNLYQYAGEILMAHKEGASVDVYRNNEITVKEILKRKYEKIIISPGPGSPADPSYFGVCAQVLLEVGKKIPVFGVCLGMQGMAHYFGGEVIRAKLPMHGKTSAIEHDGNGVFTGLPQGLQVMRYHSLVANPHMIPDCLEVSAVVQGEPEIIETSIREIPYEEKHLEAPNISMLKRSKLHADIMGLRHKEYPVEGIQFHPESFATEAGKQMIEHFLMKNVL